MSDFAKNRLINVFLANSPKDFSIVPYCCFLITDPLLGAFRNYSYGVFRTLWMIYGQLKQTFLALSIISPLITQTHCGILHATLSSNCGLIIVIHIGYQWNQN